MSEHLHPGLHPDPDSLNAFIEGVLPEHERLQCLAHVAGCSQCREVVFLAQEPVAAPAATSPAPAWRRWFAPIPVLAAAAVACVLVVAGSLYLRNRPTSATPDVVARAGPEAPVIAPPPVEIGREPRVSATISSNAESHVPPRVRLLSAAGLRFGKPAIVDLKPPSLSAPPPIPTLPGDQQISLPPAFLAAVPPAAPVYRAPADALSGIAGTVTDPTGAVVPGATVTLRQIAGTSAGNARTDAMGQFRVAGLPAGRYELAITAPGFARTSKQIDLPPQDVAIVASQLAVGSVSESVEVTAAAATIQTSSATRGTVISRKAPATIRLATPRPLPSKLPADTTVSSGKVMLAVDSDGALFYSRNRGKSWKAVKPLWRDKVVSLITLAEPAPTSAAAFQLTTDSGSTWLSRDGSHWYPAAPQR